MLDGKGFGWITFTFCHIYIFTLHIPICNYYIMFTFYIMLHYLLLVFCTTGSSQDGSGPQPN